MIRLSPRRRREMFGGRQTESDLVFCMVRDLNTIVPGCFAWRMETRGIPKWTKTGWKVDRNDMERGKADIAGVVRPMDSYGDIYGAGVSFVIEAKMPGQYLKPHQREWLTDYVTRGGGRAAVCHTSDEAMQFVKAVQIGGPAWPGEIVP